MTNQGTFSVLSVIFSS